MDHTAVNQAYTQRINHLISVIFFLLLPLSGCGPSGNQPNANITNQVPPIDPFQAAVLKVEEDRREPTGRNATVEVPSQLKHYSEPRRFLSIQVAESRRHRLQTPHDFAELVELIQQGDLIEVPLVGKGFILYGVGFSASDQPFSHYDQMSRKSVTLFGTREQLLEAQQKIDQSVAGLQNTKSTLQKEFERIAVKDHESRDRVRKEIKRVAGEMSVLKQRQELLAFSYRRKGFWSVAGQEYRALEKFAPPAGGTGYDLGAPISRKELKVRLLSYLRPAAFALLEELGQKYEARFKRPLAITSLIRTDEYQSQLRANNSNATSIEVPPHTTGLAFDIYYRYMAASEQIFMMEELARLHDQGRIETLRENRDHFHVFVFLAGKPPSEAQVTNEIRRMAD